MSDKRPIDPAEASTTTRQPLKRYRLLRNPPGALGQEFVEHADGEWVLWREVKQGRSENAKAPEAPKAERLEPLESGLDAMRERDKLAKCCACELRAKLIACRKAFEEQECKCREEYIAGGTLLGWSSTPCSRCQIVATWDPTKVSEHPGLKKLKLPAEGVLYKRAMERSAEIKKARSKVSDPFHVSTHELAEKIARIFYAETPGLSTDELVATASAKQKIALVEGLLGGFQGQVECDYLDSIGEWCSQHRSQKESKMGDATSREMLASDLPIRCRHGNGAGCPACQSENAAEIRKESEVGDGTG
jgi:hypothetical protein